MIHGPDANKKRSHVGMDKLSNDISTIKHKAESKNVSLCCYFLGMSLKIIEYCISLKLHIE